MILSVFYLSALLIYSDVSVAHAQSTPLYNSSGNASKTLYRSGAKPLSLNQITQGKSTNGYTYSRSAQTPYGTNTGSGSYLSEADIAAFRSRRAAEAQAAEQQALASLAQGHGGSQDNPLATPSAVFSGQTQGTPSGANGQAQPKKRQIYKGRETGVSTPPRVFNSVR